ncbi:MAG: hypothetical protein HRT35_00885 [Algicola sp.]|nr:hypothetical protein [Algicola sp.]
MNAKLSKLIKKINKISDLTFGQRMERGLTIAKEKMDRSLGFDLIQFAGGFCVMTDRSDGVSSLKFADGSWVHVNADDYYSEPVG